jgi:sucrose-6-phosphate hydrolase SacC (GH32 family)
MILYMINHSGKLNNFATIFDANSLNDWQMAGQGKFVIVKEEAALQLECPHVFQLTSLTRDKDTHCSIVRLRTASLLNYMSLLIQNLSLL